MKKITIGDKKHAVEINPLQMSHADMVMASYDNIEDEAQEDRLLELKRNQREVNERAKTRF